MQIEYTVHSAAESNVPVTAKLGDREVQATVPGLVVECVSNGGDHGHTFRFVPLDADDMAAHKALFGVGNRISATFTLFAEAEPLAVQEDEPVADPASEPAEDAAEPPAAA